MIEEFSQLDADEASQQSGVMNEVRNRT